MAQPRVPLPKDTLQQLSLFADTFGNAVAVGLNADGSISVSGAAAGGAVPSTIGDANDTSVLGQLEISNRRAQVDVPADNLVLWMILRELRLLNQAFLAWSQTSAPYSDDSQIALIG